jgi:hypothetical protein
MFKTTNKKETMTQINDKMDQAIMNDDFDQIEKIALNPNYALVKTTQYNMFTDQVNFVNRWVDISEVFKELWEDLNSDCHDYIMDLPQYKNMDYDQMVDDYDKKTYEWIKKTDAWNLKGFGLNYDQY